MLNGHQCPHRCQQVQSCVDLAEPDLTPEDGEALRGQVSGLPQVPRVGAAADILLRLHVLCHHRAEDRLLAQYPGMGRAPSLLRPPLLAGAHGGTPGGAG